jgi:hypothetical protein
MTAQFPITEISRTQLFLFGVQTRTFGPYLATIQRILISVMFRTRPAANSPSRQSACNPKKCFNLSVHVTNDTSYNNLSFTPKILASSWEGGRQGPGR